MDVLDSVLYLYTRTVLIFDRLLPLILPLDLVVLDM